MRHSAKTGAALVFCLGIAGISAVSAQQAPVTIGRQRARTIALQHASGTIIKQELEKEGGAWRYSFDVRQNGRIHEIGVDAETGKIVEDSWEGAPDRD
jgi:uncharacterized membrane protein YkoI